MQYTIAMSDYDNRYEAALESQGFHHNVDGTPFDDGNPEGWMGGSVRQTGGMTMCREWHTHAVGGTHDDRPGREVEYECIYGSNQCVSIQRYKWRPGVLDDGRGCYEFDGVVEARAPEENTDAAKAETALMMMQNFER